MSEYLSEIKTGFIRTELKQPNIIQRLFKSEPKENAIAEINNLLATNPVKKIKLEEIEAISTKYKVDLYKKYCDNLKGLYVIFLKHCLKDNLLTDSEIEELNYLKSILMLQDTDVENLHNKITSDIYRMYFEEAISKGKIYEAENYYLDKLQKNLKLSNDIVNKISAESSHLLVNKLISNINSHERLSPDEWNELNAIAKDLNIPVNIDSATKERFEKFKQYWLIENGQLSKIQIDLNLLNGENCYCTSNVDWYESRTITKRINYAGPTVRLQIMKGFYYRAGSLSVDRETAEKYLLIDSGKLYLTNKRLIFIGAKKNSNIKLEKILSIIPYRDGIGIQKDTGKSPLIQLKNNPDIFTMTLGRLINEIIS